MRFVPISVRIRIRIDSSLPTRLSPTFRFQIRDFDFAGLVDLTEYLIFLYRIAWHYVAGVAWSTIDCTASRRSIAFAVRTNLGVLFFVNYLCCQSFIAQPSIPLNAGLPLVYVEAQAKKKEIFVCLLVFQPTSVCYCCYQLHATSDLFGRHTDAFTFGLALIVSSKSDSSSIKHNDDDDDSSKSKSSSSSSVPLGLKLERKNKSKAF